MKASILSNRKTLAWSLTLGIHLILLLLFLLLKYNLPAAAQELDEPIEIALGTDMDGWGDDPDQDMREPAPMQAAEEYESQKDSDDQPTRIDASDNPNLVNPVSVPKNKTNATISKPKPPTNTSKPVNKTEDKPNTAQNPSTQANKGKYVFDGAEGGGGNSAAQNKPGAGSGDTKGTGTQGSPGGSPTGTNRMTYEYKLGDRKITKYPGPTATYNEGGKVKVKVWVDKDGKITRHEVQSAPNQNLRNIASQKVREIRFSKSATGQPEQSGTIEFNFATGKK